MIQHPKSNRVYLAWPVPMDQIDFVVRTYAHMLKADADYGVDEDGRWYVDVSDAECAASLQLVVHGSR